MNKIGTIKRCAPLVMAVMVMGCGGSDDGDGSSPTTPTDPSLGYVIGGSLSGLASGKNVVMQNSGGDDLRVQSNGKFAFNKVVTNGGSYVVTVLTQPDGQICAVSNGSGKASADVSNVGVTCVVNPVTPTPTPAPADALVGRWVPNGCGNLDVGGSDGTYRDYHRYARTGTDTLSNAPGRYSYFGGNCSGSRSDSVGSAVTETLRVLSSDTVNGYTVHRVMTTPQGPSGPMAGLAYQRSITFASGGQVCMMSRTETFTSAEIAQATAENIANKDQTNCGVWER
ncbi:DUF4369 domain-containing protein [Diaphorobacter sp. HDW4A]|uniref:DUF4369 domain-containing protein n=1 Tax=Diaphorobacter sp. HDW4A TaxID=2714924 RepID=UPI001407D942|nr:DUF4369 domain-containing protein [Diaphorobacter sp. HDW4A]QIL80133.1 DUF4369 domain-containing protein [Diaphorobacter sp. HDW4A]